MPKFEHDNNENRRTDSGRDDDISAARLSRLGFRHTRFTEYCKWQFDYTNNSLPSFLTPESIRNPALSVFTRVPSTVHQRQTQNGTLRTNPAPPNAGDL